MYKAFNLNFSLKIKTIVAKTAVKSSSQNVNVINIPKCVETGNKFHIKKFPTTIEKIKQFSFIPTNYFPDDDNPSTDAHLIYFHGALRLYLKIFNFLSQKKYKTQN